VSHSPQKVGGETEGETVKVGYPLLSEKVVTFLRSKEVLSTRHGGSQVADFQKGLGDKLHVGREEEEGLRANLLPPRRKKREKRAIEEPISRKKRGKNIGGRWQGVGLLPRGSCCKSGPTHKL